VLVDGTLVPIGNRRTDRETHLADIPAIGDLGEHYRLIWCTHF
jgi:hypothetical protein